ncbi:MAG TPA: bifunctional glutamate N-acetyltransferase/amino-acid acetyltransferase ArgJ, partial [Vicinamibacteria bacterium]
MITYPAGFQAAAAAAGIKPDRDDLALLVAEGPCAAAGVFTRNLATAAPVVVSREHLRSGRARAVVVNAGCANAATGEGGLRDAREMAAVTAAAVGCPPAEVVVASTGVIGVPLPMDKVRAGIAAAARALSPQGGGAAARAILTTDTRPKEVALDLTLGGRPVRLGAMAKGAGMIAPDMATMLAFFTTDVRVAPALLQRALREAVGETLNRITVDGDTSTNDMAVILASGAGTGPPIESEGPDLAAFTAGLVEASRRLAEMIVRDGEGATRIAEVRVEGARTPQDADRIARTVAESPLVKTALHGGDPNWGRILGAAGRSGVDVDLSGLDIFIGDVWVAEGGAARAYDETV